MEGENLSQNNGFILNDEILSILEQRLDASETTYLSAEDSIKELRDRFIPDWQIREVNNRSNEYLKNPSSAIDFDDAIGQIEDGL